MFDIVSGAGKSKHVFDNVRLSRWFPLQPAAGKATPSWRPDAILDGREVNLEGGVASRCEPRGTVDCDKICNLRLSAKPTFTNNYSQTTISSPF